ncbi:hypothetical protein Ga0123462_1717 [Mariprofundus ferrinatatus]|uniref:Uncharacterized protein n=1 Tax=Mariprofundus ferrinatatus TaxID=1921087 RepID=A0A2K8LE59_9PROT|nr:hypothetical protein [Mariprofundus ferrinatatus]ATX82566.1 hypothetical protein Ga0123462_1717 [Mariprofundus ferrinatatus]
MPESQSTFIWYHAENLNMSEMKKWLKLVKEQTGAECRLYVRRKEGKTTFMESYADISPATTMAIEGLAAAHPLFNGISRRAESFLRIDEL